MTDTATPDPLVTIVMPAYNAEKFIGATLQSVLHQTYGNFEVLVVDDCSTDRTAAIAEELAASDSRIQVIRLLKNYGAPAGPRNIGVQQAKGAWVAFLDADDIWHPDKLRCQVATLTTTGAQFCSTQMIDFRDEADISFTPAGDYTVRRISFLSQMVSYQTPTSSVIVDTKTIRSIPFNEDPAYKAREDMDCWLRCHELLGHSVKIEHPMLAYRQSLQQISGKKWQMVKRHHHVLRRYRFRDGRSLAFFAAPLTAAHFSRALFKRLAGGPGGRI